MVSFCLRVCGFSMKDNCSHSTRKGEKEKREMEIRLKGE